MRRESVLGQVLSIAGAYRARIRKRALSVPRTSRARRSTRGGAPPARSRERATSPGRGTCCRSRSWDPTAIEKLVACAVNEKLPALPNRVFQTVSNTGGRVFATACPFGIVRHGRSIGFRRVGSARTSRHRHPEAGPLRGYGKRGARLRARLSARPLDRAALRAHVSPISRDGRVVEVTRTRKRSFDR